MDINQSVLDSLGAKLNAADLSDEEAAAIQTAFALANDAIAERAAEDDEVSGFSQVAFRPTGFQPVEMKGLDFDVNADSQNGVNYDVNWDGKGGTGDKLL